MNKEQWYKHPSLRGDLEAILKNPVLQSALQIVADVGANSTAIPNAACDLVQYFAIMGAKKDGYHEALKNLSLLALPEKAAAPVPEPWKTPEDKKPQPK